MRPEEPFGLVQKRAFEIYERRDPQYGTAEEDWWRAKREIEREEQTIRSSERAELLGAERLRRAVPEGSSLKRS